MSKRPLAVRVAAVILSLALGGTVIHQGMDGLVTSAKAAGKSAKKSGVKAAKRAAGPAKSCGEFKYRDAKTGECKDARNKAPSK